MVQIPSQPRVYRRPDLPAFDGLPMIDRAFCSALRVARTLGDDYATEGMDLEEVGLAHTMENLLYTHWGQGGLETSDYMLGTFRAHVHLSHNVTGG